MPACRRGRVVIVVVVYALPASEAGLLCIVLDFSLFVSCLPAGRFTFHYLRRSLFPFTSLLTLPGTILYQRYLRFSPSAGILDRFPLQQRNGISRA